MRLMPPLAALPVTRMRNSSLCLVLKPLRRNQHHLTSFSFLVTTLLYILLFFSQQQQQNGSQSQVSQCHQYSSSSKHSWTAGSNNTAGFPVSAADKNSSSSEVLRLSRPFLNYLVGNLHNSNFPGARNYSEYHLIQHPQRFQILPSSVQPLRADFGPVVNDVTSFGYPIEIAPCRNATTSSKASNNGRSIGLFLAVISAPSYFNKRDVIRKTWLSQLAQLNNAGDTAAPAAVKLVGHGFIVGLTEDEDIKKRIEEESATHGDILQVDVMDTYPNLTRKVTAVLNWINSRCSRAEFVLKVDDDVYVNTHNLISVVRSLNSSHLSIVGSSADGIVRRDGKFAVSVDDWPWKNYPPYSMGAFLLMSGCVIQPLLAAAQTTPYFPFEDTYIGLCADKARVKMRFSPRALGEVMTNKPQPCYIHNSISWLTQSVKVAYLSHHATEEFYRNVTRCKKLILAPIKTPRKFDFT
ncbi:lactosylceramide 1,3-N-acetyl-beta-D-glucosaminyltransferase A-like [Daphnia pulex]|uniref:lactosylceramide 1,3-N-acetyl-beta-D-glucosaminyltransferase A-like n=1 Tax=Daphnia pulex TaxID=6669 RepID=UPI001EDD26B2|nr:lactosylceramide 1,3-N-acetyl-beta-D-glucosaminyltransferase A-like [Daphnia pulex]